ncbi:adenine-specific DNA-methyltransferase [Tenacibaculum finnmarkense]|uniref:adenine-specific DNA-methyltransferase n=1 Tax=Tenacibaculum finnmarkense TaxID=2781243 RepID=UPI000C3C8146|nr:adenine-specific DNA-methyltransferase [Tenacibaculum finnmarkense]MCD8440909.1 adenine-specific DNA-methyltransferase [Tenacibaculum finnmarkense genomovar ulcerans]MCG8721807.1 adenine-specific DNA-methyltransferase [Tenacibaculum finnmarkense]SOS56309.1 methyltransferase [Tenacibaculum finnmarkense]
MKEFGNIDHKIYQGDVIEILQNKIEDKSIDLIFVDPPYNIGKDFNGLMDKWENDDDYLKWCYQWIDLCLKKLKDNGSFYVMTSTQFIPYFDLYLRDKTNILSRIIWSYDSSGVQAKKFFGSMYEPIIFCVKDKKKYTFNSNDIQVEAKTGAKRKLIDYRKNPPQPYNTKKVPGNVWDFPRVRYRMKEYENHPTQKPTALLERIIKASSNEGDTILDPFSGTFTTSFVAKSLNRKSVGIEINEDYSKIGIRRVLEQYELNGEDLSPQPKSYQVKKTKQQKLFKEK